MTRTAPEIGRLLWGKCAMGTSDENDHTKQYNKEISKVYEPDLERYCAANAPSQEEMTQGAEFYGSGWHLPPCERRAKFPTDRK